MDAHDIFRKLSVGAKFRGSFKRNKVDTTASEAIIMVSPLCHIPRIILQHQLKVILTVN